MIPSEYANNMHEVRVIVLLETKPLSDTYMQMEFTKEQFKEISQCIQNTWIRRIHSVSGGMVVKCKDHEIPIKINGIASWYK